MIIANFKYNGETIRAQFPSNWQEMKVRHYLALETTANPLELLALLSDTDIKKILNTKTDLSPVLNKIIELLNSEPPNFKNAGRKVILIDGKPVKIPDAINNITFGQSALIEQYLSATGGDERKAIAKIMAVILQPLLKPGAFDLDHAAHLETKILERPILEVFPNVFFFWQVLKNYKIMQLLN